MASAKKRPAKAKKSTKAKKPTKVKKPTAAKPKGKSAKFKAGKDL